MAWRESQQKGNFVESERIRLLGLVDEHERMLSVVQRSQTHIGIEIFDFYQIKFKRCMLVCMYFIHVYTCKYT